MRRFKIRKIRSKKDDELKETFRDPNILAKTIEEMNLKQQEAIASIQSNLIVMDSVKKKFKFFK